MPEVRLPRHQPSTTVHCSESRSRPSDLNCIYVETPKPYLGIDFIIGQHAAYKSLKKGTNGAS
jgi:hypothetical protein